jgi:hypothetical protein
MSSSFADEMVTKLETLLRENVGVTSVNVDGRSVSYAELTAQYDYWKNRAARESGRRPWASKIKLG